LFLTGAAIVAEPEKLYAILKNSGAFPAGKCAREEKISAPENLAEPPGGGVAEGPVSARRGGVAAKIFFRRRIRKQRNRPGSEGVLLTEIAPPGSGWDRPCCTSHRHIIRVCLQTRRSFLTAFGMTGSGYLLV
jgi:hypothetical protein